MVQKLGEFAGADHCCLVDDDDAVLGKPGAGRATLEIREQRVDRVTVDSGTGVEFSGGARGQGCAHDGDACRVPRVARCIQRERLASTCFANDDLDAGARRE